MKSLFIFLMLLFFERTFLHATLPVFDASAAVSMAKQFEQGIEQLKIVKQQLDRAKDLYDVAQQAAKYYGNPSQVLGGIRDAALGGSLNPSSISSTFDHLLGSLHEAGTISSQLQGLVGAPVSVEEIRSQLLAGKTPSSNIAKYQAMEKLFDQQNQELQSASRQSAQLRSQLVDLRSQVAISPDQATTEKLTAAISSTSAALATTDSTITQLHQQMQVSAMMVQNRKMMEEAAYQEAYRQVSDQQAKDDAARTFQAFQNLNNTR